MGALLCLPPTVKQKLLCLGWNKRAARGAGPRYRTWNVKQPGHIRPEIHRFSTTCPRSQPAAAATLEDSSRGRTAGLGQYVRATKSHLRFPHASTAAAGWESHDFARMIDDLLHKISLMLNPQRAYRHPLLQHQKQKGLDPNADKATRDFSKNDMLSECNEDSWRSKPRRPKTEQHSSTHPGGEINKPQVKPIRVGRTVTEQTGSVRRDMWMWVTTLHLF